MLHGLFHHDNIHVKLVVFITTTFMLNGLFHHDNIHVKLAVLSRKIHVEWVVSS